MKLVIERRSSFGWPAFPSRYYADTDHGMAVHYDGSRSPLGLASKPHSACRDYWKRTRAFHMNGHGWLDIGYAWFACPHGRILEGRGGNRSQAAQPGGNTTWESVTFGLGVGEKPTAAQIEAFRLLRAQRMKANGMRRAIRPHSSFVATGCPGDILRRLISNGTLARKPSQEDDMNADDLKRFYKKDAFIDDPRREPKAHGKDPSVDQMTLEDVLRDLLKGQQRLLEEARDDQVNEGAPERQEVRQVLAAVQAIDARLAAVEALLAS